MDVVSALVRRGTSRHVYLALGYCGLAATVAGAALFGASTATLLATCLVVALVAPVLTRAIAFGNFDFFYPPTLLSFLILIGYVLPLGDFISGKDVFSKAWRYPYRTFEQSLNLALGMAILGGCSFFVGFAAAARIRYRPLSRISGFIPKRMAWVGVAYTLAGLGMFAIGVALVGGVGALKAGLVDRIRTFAGLNYFFMAVFLPLDFALVWWAYLLDRRRVFNVWFWLYAAFALALSSLIGSRANTLVVALAGVVVYHVMYRKISARWILALLVLGAGSLFAFQVIVLEYIAAGKLLTISPNPTFAELWGALTRSLSKDFYQIQALTMVVDTVPNGIPYQHGSTYVPLFLSPIPSSLWPGKLDFLSSPAVLTLALWPETWLKQGTTIPPSLMGEMYMNFGVPGVGIGMAVFGALYGCAYACLKRSAGNPVVTILYGAFVAMMIHYMRGEFSAPTILLMCVWLPVLAAAKLVGECRGSDVGYGSRPAAALDA